MHAATLLCITGAFVLGMVLSLLGSIKLELARRLEIGEGRVSGLVSALNLALIPLMLISGMILDMFGPRLILAVGCTVTALALYGLTLRGNYRAALASVLLLGLGAASISTAVIVLMPQAFFGQQKRIGASMNLGNVFFALGALFTPTLSELLLHTLKFKRTLTFLAILCLVPAVLASFGKVDSDKESAHVLDMIEKSNLWLAAAVFALYTPVEYSLSTWSTTLLTNLGHRERTAAWSLSGFWLTFLAGRILMAYLEIKGIIRDDAEPWVLVLLGITACVALGNVTGSANRGRAVFGLLVLGFLLGPIFPTLVGMLFRHFPNARGTAYGAMFAVGSLGSFVLIPVMGGFARNRTVQHAMRIPLLLMVLMTLAMLVLALLQ